MSSREEFEAYCREELEWTDDDLKKGVATEGRYFWAKAADGWRFWQASRQALVVDLPAKISHLPHSQVGNGFVLPEAEQYDEAIDDCREAVEAAGVRVSP